jgi:transcriptional regulator with XRE-family HTH domain
MAQRLEVATSYRISEYERGRREPHLAILLRYARAASISVECLIDDEIELPF